MDKELDFTFGGVGETAGLPGNCWVDFDSSFTAIIGGGGGGIGSAERTGGASGRTVDCGGSGLGGRVGWDGSIGLDAEVTGSGGGGSRGLVRDNDKLLPLWAVVVVVAVVRFVEAAIGSLGGGLYEEAGSFWVSNKGLEKGSCRVAAGGGGLRMGTILVVVMDGVGTRVEWEVVIVVVVAVVGGISKDFSTWSQSTSSHP